MSYKDNRILCKKYIEDPCQNNFSINKESLSFRILGFCPIFLITDTAINAFIFGIIFILILLYISLIMSVFRTYIIKHDIYTITCTFFIFLITFFIQNFIEHFSVIWLQNFWKHSYVAILFSNCIFLERINLLIYNKYTFSSFIFNNFRFGYHSLIMFLFIGIFREIFEKGNIFTDIEKFFGKKNLENLHVKVFSENSHLIFSNRISIPIVFILLGLFFSIKNFLKLNKKK